MLDLVALGGGLKVGAGAVSLVSAGLGLVSRLEEQKQVAKRLKVFAALVREEGQYGDFPRLERFVERMPKKLDVVLEAMALLDYFASGYIQRRTLILLALSIGLTLGSVPDAPSIPNDALGFDAFTDTALLLGAFAVSMMNFVPVQFDRLFKKDDPLFRYFAAKRDVEMLMGEDALEAFFAVY